MKDKSETRQHVIDFIKMIEIQHKSHVKIVRSDNGVEFLMPQFYSSKGIIHQTSCVETPEQNGRVERKHQHLLNVGRALLFQANLPKTFWSYAVQHAVYLINRIPSSVLKNKSPYELLHNEKPQIEHLKVFGSLAYAPCLHIEVNLIQELENAFSWDISKVSKGLFYMIYILSQYSCLEM
jgi:hypothetical protein